MDTKCIAIVAVLLVACEGEPPKLPVGIAVVTPEPAATATAEEPAAEPGAVTPAPSRGALPPCACACNCGSATAVAADGGAPIEGGAAPAAVVAAAPAAVTASVSGTLTTVPKIAAASAVVYLEGAPIEPTAKMTATITNKTMTFQPFVAVVPVGGKIIFRNDDPFPHNVFSADGEGFNMGMIPQHEARQRIFKNARAYSLLCNVHPGMLGYVVVVPSSYFAKTDAQGHFVIKNVPAGTYKVTAWAPRQQLETQPVTVNSGDVAVNFELHR